MDIDPGTIVANRYRVSRPLGRGGMGEVYAAENVRTGRHVAVKLLRADSKSKSSAVERFRREARAAGSINSDHVTQVLDVEDDPEHGIALVFELLEGESLIDRLKRTGPISFDELHGLVEQVLIGLADAHRAGIIHRDLKPSNVFLERRPDGATRVKILDFGISKLPREMGGETLTEMGQSLGTFSFMPPEQIGKAKTVDHRADIYAAGTLVYQSLTGQLPYNARNVLVLVEMKTKQEPRSLADAMKRPVDPRLEAFVAKTLAREPDQRYQTALDCLQAWRELKPRGDLAASSAPSASSAPTGASGTSPHAQTAEPPSSQGPTNPTHGPHSQAAPSAERPTVVPALPAATPHAALAPGGYTARPNYPSSALPAQQPASGQPRAHYPSGSLPAQQQGPMSGQQARSPYPSGPVPSQQPPSSGQHQHQHHLQQQQQQQHTSSRTGVAQPPVGPLRNAPPSGAYPAYRPSGTIPVQAQQGPQSSQQQPASGAPTSPRPHYPSGALPRVGNDPLDTTSDGGATLMYQPPEATPTSRGPSGTALMQAPPHLVELARQATGGAPPPAPPPTQATAPGASPPAAGVSSQGGQGLSGRTPAPSDAADLPRTAGAGEDEDPNDKTRLYVPPGDPRTTSGALPKASLETRAPEKKSGGVWLVLGAVVFALVGFGIVVAAHFARTGTLPWK